MSCMKNGFVLDSCRRVCAVFLVFLLESHYKLLDIRKEPIADGHVSNGKMTVNGDKNMAQSVGFLF